MDFVRTVYSTIMSGVVVCYKPVNGDGEEISASRDGVAVTGSFYPLHELDIDDFILVLGSAYRKHRLINGGASKSDIDEIPIKNEPTPVIATHKAKFGGDDEIIEQRPRLKPSGN